MSDKNGYWFPAKTYGWGWGLPFGWQGWLVYGIAGASLVIGYFVFPPAAHPVAHLVYSLSVVSLLLITCWIKGEPPKWRWGK